MDSPRAALTAVSACRHSDPAPPPPDHPPSSAENPLLSAIERAGQADARTVRMRTSHFVARASAARLSGQQEARPLLSPGRTADGTRLVRLVRRALSFEQPADESGRDEAQSCPPLQAARDVVRARAVTEASRAADQRGGSGDCERLASVASDRPSNGFSERTARSADERVSNGTCEQISNGACERTSNGTYERVSNGTCERISNGAGERTSNGTCDRVSNGSCERVSNGSCESYSNGHSVTNGTSSGRATDGDQLENGTSALNRKGSRNFKSNNLIKRLFKKEEPEPEDEVETRQQDETVSSAFIYICTLSNTH